MAADLVRRGVTRASRIAAEGGSNGGILITNMLVRYPERFGALFCTIPADRHAPLHQAAGGRELDRRIWRSRQARGMGVAANLFRLSYCKPGQKYPPILIATTRRDDRVHPGHARKMAAKLQAMGYEAWFYEPAAGGHGYGKDNRSAPHSSRSATPS